MLDNLQNNQYFFFGLVIFSFILTKVPIIGKYFRVANTLIHESGHAFVALITSGTIDNIELFSNTSGTTVTRSKSKIGQILVSIAGYPFSSASAFCLFYLLKIHLYQIILFSLAVLAFLNIIFWVRNSYGIFWLITFILILLGVYYWDNSFAIYCLSIVISAIVLTDSFYSTLELAYLCLFQPKNAGDAATLKKFTYIPSIFWALIFIALSVFFVYQTILLFFPGVRLY